MLGHRSWYCGARSLGEKGITVRVVHTMSVGREIPIRGNVPAKQIAMTGYPRNENIDFSRTIRLLVPPLLMVKAGVGVDMSVLAHFPLDDITE